MAEKLNGPGFGARMAMAQQAGKLVEDSNARWRKVRDRDEALRGLLSAWRVRAESDNPSEYLDMSEMVDQLAAVLDGEQ